MLDDSRWGDDPRDRDDNSRDVSRGSRGGSDPRAFLSLCRSLGFSVSVQLPDEKGVLEFSDDEILKYCEGDGGEAHLNLVLQRA